MECFERNDSHSFNCILFHEATFYDRNEVNTNVGIGHREIHTGFLLQRRMKW
jgi:hypothetical protein